MSGGDVTRVEGFDPRSLAWRTARLLPGLTAAAASHGENEGGGWVKLENEEGTDSVIDAPETGTVWRNSTKVGRHEPCPCGSGKKFKKCCGAVTLQ